MKFGVYGNCQIHAFGPSLTALLPGCTVDLFNAELAKTARPNPGDYDLVFVQPNFFAHFRPAPQIRPFPNVIFTGFHPDCTILYDDDRKVIPSAVSDYNSSLVAACFVRGVPVDCIAEWLSRPRLQQLGVLAEFGRAKRFFFEHARSMGLDIAAVFDGWMKHGTAFMYTFNHPASPVIYDLCRLVLIREGFSGLNAPEIPPDTFGDGAKWAVYPPVAEQIGIAEQPVFEYPKFRARTEGREGLLFPDFAAGCYEILTRYDLAVIARASPVAKLLQALG